MSSFAVILPAAGKSARFGQGEKKPFINIDGRAIWQRTAELFWTRDDVSKVYIVISPEDEEMFERRYRHVIAFANAKIVLGGAERFESVANALKLIPDDVEFVAIHDAVRPVCTTALIDDVFAAARKTGAAMLGVPVPDTLKRVDPHSQNIRETVAREGLWAAQTPQAFRRDWLVEAYAKRSQYPVAITDDAQLIEALGHPVRMVPGSPTNLKITTKDDLEIADAILKERKSRPGPKVVHPFGDEAKW